MHCHILLSWGEFIVLVDKKNLLMSSFPNAVSPKGEYYFSELRIF